MSQKRHTVDQIIAKLRRADVVGFPQSMIQGLSENLSLGIRWLAVAEQVAEA